MLHSTYNNWRGIQTVPSRNLIEEYCMHVVFMLETDLDSIIARVRITSKAPLVFGDRCRTELENAHTIELAYVLGSSAHIVMGKVFKQNKRGETRVSVDQIDPVFTADSKDELHCEKRIRCCLSPGPSYNVAIDQKTISAPACLLGFSSFVDIVFAYSMAETPICVGKIISTQPSTTSWYQCAHLSFEMLTFLGRVQVHFHCHRFYVKSFLINSNCWSQQSSTGLSNPRS